MPVQTAAQFKGKNFNLKMEDNSNAHDVQAFYN